MKEKLEAAAREAVVLAGYIYESGLARERGVSTRTLCRERALRIGPPWTKFGKRVFYRIEAVRQWLLEQEQRRDGRAA